MTSQKTNSSNGAQAVNGQQKPACPTTQASEASSSSGAAKAAAQTPQPCSDTPNAECPLLVPYHVTSSAPHTLRRTPEENSSSHWQHAWAYEPAKSPSFICETSSSTARSHSSTFTAKETKNEPSRSKTGSPQNSWPHAPQTEATHSLAKSTDTSPLAQSPTSPQKYCPKATHSTNYATPTQQAFTQLTKTSSH